jgi:hypothetical protein
MLFVWITYAATQSQDGKKNIALFASTHQRNVAYKTPEGTATVRFIIQRDNKWIIKSVKTTPVKWDATSFWYMESFWKKISGAVVWKSLKNLSIKSVGWASLTTNAFNAYIKTIK